MLRSQNENTPTTYVDGGLVNWLFSPSHLESNTQQNTRQSRLYGRILITSNRHWGLAGCLDTLITLPITRGMADIKRVTCSH